MGLFSNFKVCKVSHDDFVGTGSGSGATAGDGTCRSGGWCSERRGETETLVWDVHR